MRNKIVFSASEHCLVAKSEKFVLSSKLLPKIYIEFAAGSEHLYLDFYNVTTKKGTVGLSYCPLKRDTVYIYLPYTNKITSLVIRQDTNEGISLQKLFSGRTRAK